MAAVLARDIVKSFGDVLAVNGISLAVADSEFMVLLGPSGCGKTTFLRIICGLESQTSGDLVIGGHLVNDVPPRARGVAMMFQSYGLYPHYTVRNNIAFPLRTQRVPRAEIERKVEWASHLLGIEHLLDRRPRQLSRTQPRQDPSREVVDHRVQVGAGPIEQADDGGVDVPHLVGSRRAQPDLGFHGMHAEPGPAPAMLPDEAVPGGG